MGLCPLETLSIEGRVQGCFIILFQHYYIYFSLEELEEQLVWQKEDRDNGGRTLCFFYSFKLV